ncbi:glycosyl hydrolase family 57 [Murinocardiopsis flavida]|uniref:Glycosyl hydrolase family 57 n=1 Tax=Murinocardiopsis flavida TaxID=645275 RepID=A0A2P8DE75_9ACTN|nr:glycosyl hydrolase family 57 [Murinocardiopsis flavida]
MAMAAALAPVLAGSLPAHGTAGAPLAAPAIEAPKDAGDPLVIDDITPESVDSKSTVRVTGRITNTTDKAVKDITVRMRYSAAPLAGRAQVRAHAAGDRNTPPATGPDTTVAGPIEPGESAEYELKADAKDLGFDTYGVYPMTIEADRPSGKALGSQDSFLPYKGGGKADPVKVSWVWPLMDQPQRADDDTFLGNELDEEVGPEGRLGRLLSIGGQTGHLSLQTPEPSPPDETPASPASPSPSESPQKSADASDDDGDPTAKSSVEPPEEDRVPVTWAVDPALLEDIERISDSGYRAVADSGAESTAPATKKYAASSNARMWLRQAKGIIGDEPLIATPYADPDLAALLREGLEDDAEASIELGRQAVEETLGRTADPTVAWPSGGVMNDATHEFLHDNGAERYLLSDAAMPPERWLGHTPTAQAPIPESDESAASSAVVADSGLTSILGQSSWGPGEAALAKQRFAAETMMITAERPGEERTIVLAPPRDWDPSPELADELLKATESLPWIEPVALDDIKGAGKGGDQRRSLTYPEKTARSELGGGYLDQVKDVRGDIRLFNSVLTDHSDPFRRSVLRMESAAWRGDTPKAEQVRTIVADAVSGAKGKVRIMPGEPYQLLGESGKLPIVVANDLTEHPVRVRLSIRSENAARLEVGDLGTAEMDIAPTRKTTVYVPIESHVNGRTVLHAQVQNQEGEPLNVHEVTTPVTTSGTGTTALYITYAAAGVLLIALLPRVLRKWRRLRFKGGPRASVVPPGTPPTGSLDDDAADSGHGDAAAAAPAAEPGSAHGTADGPDPAGNGSASPADPPPAAPDDTAVQQNGSGSAEAADESDGDGEGPEPTARG